MSLADFPDLLARLEQGRAKSVIAPLEDLVATAPRHVAAQVALARAYEMEGRREDARRRWQRAYLLMPGSPTVRAGLERMMRPVPGGDTAVPESTAPAEAVPSMPSPEKQTSPEGEHSTPRPVEPPAPSEISASKEAALPEDKEGAEPPAGEPVSPAASPQEEGTERETPAETSDSTDELDSLIKELEGANFDPREAPDKAPPPDLDDDIDDMVSPTLARIYAMQGQYREAADVYRRLAERDPDHADDYRRQADEMNARAEK